MTNLTIKKQNDEIEKQNDEIEMVSLEWHNEQVLRAESIIEEYQNKIKNGTLIELPCAVGDTIYRIGYPNKVWKWEIAYVEIYEDEIVIVDDADNTFNAEDIGKEVFLTRADAEKKVRELENDSTV